MDSIKDRISDKVEELRYKWHHAPKTMLTVESNIEDFTADLQELYKEIEVILEEEINEKQEEIDMLNGEVEDLKFEYDDLIKDNERLGKKVSNLEGKIDDWYALFDLIKDKFM